MVIHPYDCSHETSRSGDVIPIVGPPACSARAMEDD